MKYKAIPYKLYKVSVVPVASETRAVPRPSARVSVRRTKTLLISLHFKRICPNQGAGERGATYPRPLCAR